jgi:hypothetical protein
VFSAFSFLRKDAMNKKTSLIIFYFGLLVVCMGAILIASKLLNPADFEFKSLFRPELPGSIKLFAGISLFIIGLIIMRLAVRPAGKSDGSSSFRERLKKYTAIK